MRGRVEINGRTLSIRSVRELEALYGPIPPGRYWYDVVSGLFGRWGEPALGQLQAGMRLGGPLRADASAGGSEVLLNGRRLPQSEVERDGQLKPGHYWMDDMGNVGRQSAIEVRMQRQEQNPITQRLLARERAIRVS